MTDDLTDGTWYWDAPGSSAVYVRCPACRSWVSIPENEQPDGLLFVASCRQCALTFDWRLPEKKRYLESAVLYWRPYAGETQFDHAHCAFCFQRFMDIDHPEYKREGYTTEDEHDWICDVCFQDFKDDFRWIVEIGP
jgi:hypothetical protein